ncbi:acyl carrier protein phosphodiesterase [Aureivirga marina]|uniref:acyl carrier protein phosphodiesterase n=1 Tax=Aureivirga marina TaxID=1182451 RepID=UPI0018CA30D1|nr:acyl carrier protein phosphodiesterase [Aureivirga marina]
MNYLAHTFLSFNNENICIGNFIADAVKGKQYLDYNSEIQQGILLHRAIDEFTDSNPIFKRSKKRLDEKYRHYSGVIIDIFYDHFLAKNWELYSSTDLNVYAERVYTLLEKHASIMPEKALQFFVYLKRENMLYNYENVKSIEKVLIGMSHRTKHDSKMEDAIVDLRENYSFLENDFHQFMTDVIPFSREKLTLIKQQQKLLEL